MLGFDPLYVANEGILLAIVEAGAAGAALEGLRAHPLGAAAAQIGRVTETHPGVVALRTGIGGTRVVDMLPGDQLPRIALEMGEIYPLSVNEREAIYGVLRYDHGKPFLFEVAFVRDGGGEWKILRW